MKKSFDKHLNIFMSYGSDCKLENNITKALINTLEYADKEKFDKIEFLRELIGDNKYEILEKGKDYYLEFDLQNPYISREEIREINIPKYLIGLSPEEGKGKEYYNIYLKHLKTKEDKNKNEIIEAIFKEIEEIEKEKEDLEQGIKEDLKQEIKEEIERYISRGGSIPDAWIFVYDNEKSRNNENLKLIIAIENKLRKLDRSQLLNHVSESLGRKEEESEEIIKTESFKKLIKILNKFNKNDPMINNFSDYMIKLMYVTDNSTDKITEEDIQYLEQNFKYEKDDINKKNKIHDMSIMNKKLGKIFANYKERKNEFHFESKNWIKKNKGMELNLTYQICHFNEEKNALLIAIEIGVQGKTKIIEKLEKLIKNYGKNEIMEIFDDKESIDGKIRSSYNIYYKIRKIPAKTYYEIKPKNTYQTLEECIDILKKISNTGFCERNLTYEEFEKKAIEKIQKKNIKKEFKIENWKTEGVKNFDLITYLRFIDYIPYEEICDKNENEVFDIIDKVVEKQMSKAERIENKLNEI